MAFSLYHADTYGIIQVGKNKTKIMIR